MLGNADMWVAIIEEVAAGLAGFDEIYCTEGGAIFSASTLFFL